MSKYKQGDIVRAAFNFTDKKGAKVRPALILSNNTIDGNFYGEVLAIGISTSDNEDGFSLLVDNERLERPLPKKSYFRLLKVQNLTSNEIEGKISKLNNDYLKEVVDIFTSYIKTAKK